MTNEIINPVEAVAGPKYKLFSPGAVTWAALLGSPLAGAIVMGINYARWGEKGKAWGAVALGVLGTAALIGVGTVWPAKELSLPLAIGAVVAMRQLAVTLQGKKLEEHLAAGGRQASTWIGAGIGVLVLLLFFGAVAIGSDKLQQLTGGPRQVTVGPDETVVYSNGVTKETAQALGAKLHEIGFLKDEAATIYISGTGADKELSFVVVDEAWDRPEVVSTLKAVAEQVAGVIGGKPVTVRMLDSQAKEKNRVRVE